MVLKKAVSELQREAAAGAANLVRQRQNRDTGPQRVDARAVRVVPANLPVKHGRDTGGGHTSADMGVSRNRSPAKPRSTFFCQDTKGANMMRAGSTPIDAACSLRLSIAT